MSSATLRCPQCKFENHASCRFCIRCGSATGSSGPEPPKRRLPSAPDVEAGQLAPVDATPSEKAAFLLESIATDMGLRFEKRTQGIVMEFDWQAEKGGERKQRVHITCDGHDDAGRELISIISICGTFEEQNAQELLLKNERLPHCGFAVRKIQGQLYIVVSATRLAEVASREELQATVRSVAEQADRWERAAAIEDKF